jgi:hypothetical protein
MNLKVKQAGNLLLLSIFYAGSPQLITVLQRFRQVSF